MKGSQIGLIGVGHMGTAMLKRFVAVGCQVTAHDTRAEARAQIEALGAQSAASLDELRGHRLVAIVVTTDDQVLDVANSLIPSMSEGSNLVIHSTVLPETILAVEAQAANHGIGVVDAPVSGGNVKAAQGELVLYVGGADEVVAACLHELEALGSVRRIGPLGSGQAMKIVNNMMQFGHHALAHEGLKLAEALGIDPEVARTAALEGSGACYMLEHLDRIDLHYAESGPERWSWLGKDTWSALLLAHDVKVRLPVAAVVYQVMHGYVAERSKRVLERSNNDRA